MATFTPSKYQKTVYTYIQKGKGNAVIDAVAGSGKSTTIVNALKLIPSDKQVLFLAFNKSIVEELKIKIGNMPNVTVSTLHSLGCKAVMKTFNSKINSDKYLAYLNDGIRYNVLTPNVSLEKEAMEDWKSNVRSLIDLGRVNLATDDNSLADLACKHNLILENNEVEIALRVIRWGESETSIIDFTDMIYYPCVKNLKMYQYDWVFIDECQDLNAAQRTMFLKCVKPSGRFIAVGDPRQAIYGFAGADVESFNLLKQIPNTAKLPLSVCYRCDSKIIEKAKEIVPQIEARENAPEGVIETQSKIEDVKDGDMILCRVSAPLVALCIHYISKGVKAYVKGRDIGVNLINMIKSTNRKNISDVIDKLTLELNKKMQKVMKQTKCTEEEAKKSSMYLVYEDKINAIEILSEGLQTSDEVIDRINTIFNDDSKNGICLSTVHKSKGLESDRVFILNSDKFFLKHCMQVDWMAEQEYNLVYVALTRAKHFLGYIAFPE